MRKPSQIAEFNFSKSFVQISILARETKSREVFGVSGGTVYSKNYVRNQRYVDDMKVLVQESRDHQKRLVDLGIIDAERYNEQIFILDCMERSIEIDQRAVNELKGVK